MSQRWVRRCHMWLPMGQGLVCQLATRWSSHLLKGNFIFKICPKLPPKCNFNCYLHQGFHWLGPDTVIDRWWMRSSTVLTMSWFQAVDTSKFTCLRTQKREFLCGDEVALPRATPINPYLGGSVWKKWSIFLSQAPLQFAQNCISGLKNNSRQSPEAPGMPEGVTMSDRHGMYQRG